MTDAVAGGAGSESHGKAVVAIGAAVGMAAYSAAFKKAKKTKSAPPDATPAQQGSSTQKDGESTTA